MIYQRGDIVRLPNRRNYDVYRLDDGKYDAFKIEELSDGMVHLDHISTLIPLSEILPLPINEKTDKHIYLDIPIAITIMSPGQPVSPIRMEQLYDFTAPTLSRNPQIISIFNLFDLAEQRGLGFRTVRALPTTYKIPLPQVTYNDPYIVVTLPKNYDVSMTDSVLSEREKRALDYVRLKRAVTRKEYQEYMNLQERTAGRDLLRLVQLGYLDTVGDGKNLKYVVTEVVSRQIK